MIVAEVDAAEPLRATIENRSHGNRAQTALRELQTRRGWGKSNFVPFIGFHSRYLKGFHRKIFTRHYYFLIGVIPSISFIAHTIESRYEQNVSIITLNIKKNKDEKNISRISELSTPIRKRNQVILILL